MKALTFNTSVSRYLTLKTLGTLSKRLYYNGPLASVKLAEYPEPGAPDPGWVKIATEMCGFCASDLNLIFLRDSPSASPFTSFPCVLGHEICGRVVEVGEGVTGIEPGQRVTIAVHLNCETRGLEAACPACRAGMVGSCQNFAAGSLSPGMFIGICADTGGGFSPYFMAHQSQIIKLPPDMPPEQGVLIEPLSIALQAVLNNMPQPGEEVLVVGGGVIGSLIVQTVRVLSPQARITVSEPSPWAAEFCRQGGADHVITDGDLFDAAVRYTGAERFKPLLGQDILMGGFARAYDTVGSTRTLNTVMRCLAAGGTLSIVGIGHDVKLDLTPLWLKLQTIKGVFSYGYVDFLGRRRHVFEVAVDLAHQGQVQLERLITHRFVLEEYRRMIEVNLHKERHRAMKTVVSFA
jgi:threonine dehydrogenase-like Zn-dependent dehydrogenase